MTADAIIALLPVSPAIWLLVLARVAGLAWLAPAWALPELGWRLRMGLCLIVTILIVPVVGPAVQAPAQPMALAQACLIEVLVGAAMGWTAALVVAGARQAGEIVAAQAGLWPSGLIDPNSGEGITPLGMLYGLVALMAFLMLDGPVALVGALIESYRALPAGTFEISSDIAGWALNRVGLALALALRAAAPVAIALVLAGIALGLLGRAAPSVQAMALALPVRTALGLLLVLISLAALGAILTAAWADLPGLAAVLPIG
jgi:flagellar biosynthesis protein FliR